MVKYQKLIFGTISKHSSTFLILLTFPIGRVLNSWNAYPPPPPPPNVNWWHTHRPPSTNPVVDGPLPGLRGHLPFLGLESGVALQHHRVCLHELGEEGRRVDAEAAVRYCSKGTTLIIYESYIESLYTQWVLLVGKTKLPNILQYE